MLLEWVIGMTHSNCNLQQKRFNLQDIQEWVNRSILLASLVKNYRVCVWLKAFSMVGVSHKLKFMCEGCENTLTVLAFH